MPLSDWAVLQSQVHHQCHQLIQPLRPYLDKRARLQKRRSELSQILSTRLPEIRKHEEGIIQMLEEVLLLDSSEEIKGVLCQREYVDEVRVFLSYYDRINGLEKSVDQLELIFHPPVDQPSEDPLSLSHPPTRQQTAREIAEYLEATEEAIHFFRTHYDFFDAPQFLRYYENLQKRICLYIKRIYRTTIQDCVKLVEKELLRTMSGKVETQIFYTDFRVAAENIRFLAEVLVSKIQGKHWNFYKDYLDELQLFYAQWRIKLVTPSVLLYLQEITQAQDTQKLSDLGRLACQYMLGLTHLEAELFAKFFMYYVPQSAYQLLVSHFADILHGFLAPKIQHSGDVLDLAQLIEWCMGEVMAPNKAKVSHAHQTDKRMLLIEFMNTVSRLCQLGRSRILEVCEGEKVPEILRLSSGVAPSYFEDLWEHSPSNEEFLCESSKQVVSLWQSLQYALTEEDVQKLVDLLYPLAVEDARRVSHLFSEDRRRLFVLRHLVYLRNQVCLMQSCMTPSD